ncbi:MAG TPA: helix-turn-helix transcriptional regulator [Pseudonocardia sp.]|jgi:transcriptional regulator with XRE-family HTH domain
MSDEPQRRTTAEPITAVVAARVRYLRESAGMSQEDLAQALNKVGVAWKRATVVNLETRAPDSRGKGPGRDSVTLEELLGLALVLGVPPIGLLLDLRTSEPTPITNHVSAPPMEVALWAIGRRPMPDLQADNGDSWHDTAEALEDAWEIEAAIASLQSLMSIRERGARASTDDEDINDQEAAERMDRKLLLQIQRGLNRLTNTKHPPPPLPDFILTRADELDIKLVDGPAPGTDGH